jgi:LPXTG-motif cell wall-anchored protein
VVTNGLKQSTLELVVDLDRFVMVDGNVPLPTLPKTGSTSNQPIQLALATIAFGAFLVVIRRRLRNV